MATGDSMADRQRREPTESLGNTGLLPVPIPGV